MTKKEQLLYLREQAKKSGDANLKKLIVIAAKSGSQSAENQKKIWSKVGSVVDKFKNAEKAAEKAQKASVAKKVASKPKKASKPVSKKAKPASTPKPKKKSGRGPKSRGETFFGRAKMIREQNPSLTWKEAQAEAKKFFADEKSRKAKAVQDAIKSFPNLKKATKDTTNIQKDAAQPAMPPGKRKSRPGAKREFYWETRSNRSDIRQPSKKYPMLEKGGKVVAPSPRYLSQYMMGANLDNVDQAMRALEMTLKQGRSHAEIAKDLGFADKLKKGGNRFKRGGKIDRDMFYPSVMAGMPEWKQIYDLTDRNPQGLYATLSPAQIELLKTIWNKQTSNGITAFEDVGQGLLVRSKSGTPSKEMYDAAIASVAEVPGIGGFQIQGKNEVFLDYASSDVFLEVIRPMMDSEMEYDGKEFLEAKIGTEAGYPFAKGGTLNTVKDLSTAMGMDVDEDGFPEDLDVSLDLRKKVRADEKFAQKVREAIIETSTMSSMDVQEAARIFRELGIDMDYDLGGEPIGMSLMKRGGRFQKGGSVSKFAEGGRPGDIKHRLATKAEKREFLSDNNLQLLMRGKNYDFALSEKVVGLIDKFGGMTLTDGKREMVITRKPHKILKQVGLATNKTKAAFESLTQLEKGGKVSRSQKLAKKKIAKGLNDVEQALKGASKKHKAQSQEVKEMKALLDDQFEKGGSVDADVKSILNDLKKGDRIVLDYTGGMASGQITLEFVSKRRVGKGKTFEKDKWTFKNPNNPKGVKYFAYASDGGVPRFAVGNLAISPKAIEKVQK
jgi:hypothetical protein